ncbi:unnamed protein product [Tetraodon nigroviridis]|uniref:(spotted green pufferfish) hypothetical protein n=1 Tax=Tetraodon nigroviridis TaxID=99883 RepID=Q4RLL9_TETNG|nr:unnamed protein product [Tetraodon nigroviridis]
MMEDKRKKRSPKVSLPQPPPPPINPRKLPALPASKSATFSLGLPQPPSPKNRGKYKRSVGQAGQPKESPQGETSGPAASRAQQGGPVLPAAALLPDRCVRCPRDGGRPSSTSSTTSTQANCRLLVRCAPSSSWSTCARCRRSWRGCTSAWTATWRSSRRTSASAPPTTTWNTCSVIWRSSARPYKSSTWLRTRTCPKHLDHDDHHAPTPSSPRPTGLGCYDADPTALDAEIHRRRGLFLVGF